MSEAGALVDRLFSSRHGELVCGGVTVSEVARVVGTPVFVYDRGVLEAAVARLRRALSERFDVYYSIKANPNRAILEAFLACGCGLEIASAGEYHQAAAAGCDPRRILFAGPGKTVHELEHVLAAGIGEIHAESMREIERLGALARDAGRTVAVAVRINPGAAALGGAMRMGGLPSPFGIDEEELDRAVERVLAEPALSFHGVHLFSGTQILGHETLVRQYEKGLEIGRRAARRAGRPLKTLDFGGGLGIPYYKGEQPLDVEALGREVRELMRREAGGAEFEGTRFIVEPGRFLVGEAGVYVCRVQDVKVSRFKRFAITDGGMHHHLAASGNLGQVIKRNFPVAVLNKLDRPAGGKVDVVGPLCTPLDVLARDVELPEIEVGDLIAVFQSGAYARAASPLGFLSHPSPPEVLAHEGRFRVVRNRGTFESLMQDQPGGES